MNNTYAAYNRANKTVLDTYNIVGDVEETGLQKLAEEYLNAMLRYRKITVHIGSVWIDTKYYEDFVRYIIGYSWYGGAVTFNRTTGKFSVKGSNYSAQNKNLRNGFVQTKNAAPILKKLLTLNLMLPLQENTTVHI